MVLFVDVESISTGMRLIGLAGAAVVGIGILWRKCVTPFYSHTKRLTTGVIAASELIQAQMGGLVDKVNELVQANKTEVEGLARVVADVARIDQEQKLVAGRLTIEQAKVANLAISVAGDVRAQLQEDLGAVRMEQAQIAERLKTETLKVAAVLARTSSLEGDTLGQLQKDMVALKREHEFVGKRLTKVEGLLVTLTEQGLGR